jgi:DNA (cytosine-5)-methyltransferase 1
MAGGFGALSDIPSLSRPFKFIDLFAGIGGFHLAMSQLGGTCVYTSEIDEDCRQVYRANFSDADDYLHGAIEETTRTSKTVLQHVPEHDVLCAGFPCQPFSKSGAQLGMRDRIRGTLFFHIMEVVRARHPRFVVLENVRNLAGPRHRDTWDTIIASLRAEGYAVSAEPAVFSPHLLPREFEGRPQVRERVFILGRYVGESATNLVDLPPIVANRAVDSWTPDKWSIYDLLEDESAIDRNVCGLRPQEILWLLLWQDFIRRIEGPLPGFPIWVDEFRTVGRIDASLPTWKQTFIQKNRSFYAANRKAIDGWLKANGDLKGLPASRRKFEWQAGRDHSRDFAELVIHLRPSGIRVRPPTYVPALVAITQTSIIGRYMRRISPREAARLQGFPDSFSLHESTAVAYRQLGNAVNVGVVKYVARHLFDDELAGAPMRLLAGVA